MAAISLLLVDDNPAYVRLTSILAADALAEEPEVRSAGSIREAEAALAEQPADVVLLDLGLPDSEGFAGLERVRAAGAKAVVVLSGRSDDGIAERALEHGAAAYVLKGSEMEQLPAALRAAGAA